MLTRFQIILPGDRYAKNTPSPTVLFARVQPSGHVFPADISQISVLKANCVRAYGKEKKYKYKPSYKTVFIVIWNTYVYVYVYSGIYFCSSVCICMHYIYCIYYTRVRTLPTRSIGVSPSPAATAADDDGDSGADVRCRDAILLLPQEIWPTLTFLARAVIKLLRK